MNLDRSIFLALTLSIASVACSAASADEAATGEDDVTGAACRADGDEGVSPVAEGTCSALFERAQEQDFARLTATTEGGKPLFETLGCVPSRTGEGDFGEEGKPGPKPCATDAADLVWNRCTAYSGLYKKTAAADAVRCLETTRDLTSASAVHGCGLTALDRSCAGQASAEETCTKIEQAREGLSAVEASACRTQVGGLKAEARKQLVLAAQEQEVFTLRTEIEAVDFATTAGR